MAEFPGYVVCVTHLSRPKTSAHRCRSSVKPPTPAANPCCWRATSTWTTPGKVLGGLGGEFRPLSDTAQLTFPSDRPSIRIDYILGRGLPQSAKIAERTVDYTTVASDHCPLWVSLVW